MVNMLEKEKDNGVKTK